MNNHLMTASKTPCGRSTAYLEYSNLIKEINNYMPEFNASIKDLQEPSQTFVTQFYTDVFREFFCNVMNLTDIPAFLNLTYIEMYNETVPIVQMCEALRFMFTKLGVDDFGLNDICDPNPKRTYKLLQTMINFIKYSDEKISQTDEKMKRVRNLKIIEYNLKKQKELLKSSINHKKLLFKKYSEEINNLTEDLIESKAELKQFLLLKEHASKEMDDVKQEQESIEKSNKYFIEQKNSLIKDINKLREQIVETPDLLKADHEKLKRTKMETIEKKKATLNQINAIKQTLKILKQELVAQESRYRLLFDQTQQIAFITEKENEFDELTKNLIDHREKYENLVENIEMLNNEHNEMLHKINVLSIEIENEKCSINNKIGALQLELDEKLKKMKNINESIKKIANEIDIFRLKESELRQIVTDILRDFNEYSNLIIHKQNCYKEELTKKLKKLI
ncbi:uncharacterized protein LOC126904842 [Daktulosphaira vitifoliae]|uniref:uncharacterized protein LOC126904842 n=1 Tax=Daktulosphaira vitifoliae TaxID=58002 RepID=UPI0021A9848E|nr:uncharacterized protein LOC126904842 [Daktulosphaira vitifoliae]